MRASRCIGSRSPAESPPRTLPGEWMDATRQPTVRLVLVGTDLFERLPVDVEQPDVRFDALPPEWACFSTSRDRRSD